MKTSKSKIRKLYFNQDHEPDLDPKLVRLRIINPTGEYEPDYRYTMEGYLGFNACLAKFKVCWFNPFTWLFVIFLFLASIMGCGLKQFFKEFKEELIGEHKLLIRKKYLGEYLK